MTLLTLSEYVATDGAPIANTERLRKVIQSTRRQYARALQVAKLEGRHVEAVPVPPVLAAVAQPSRQFLVDPEALTAALTRSAADALREGLT